LCVFLQLMLKKQQYAIIRYINSITRARKKQLFFLLLGGLFCARGDFFEKNYATERVRCVENKSM